MLKPCYASKVFLHVELECWIEIRNHNDLFSVIVVKLEVMVGHLQRKIFSMCSTFILGDKYFQSVNIERFHCT